MRSRRPQALSSLVAHAEREMRELRRLLSQRPPDLSYLAKSSKCYPSALASLQA